MENTNRNVFGIHGASGIIVVTLIWVAMLGVFTYFAIVFQQEIANKPYTLNASELKMKSAQNADQIKIKEWECPLYSKNA